MQVEYNFKFEHQDELSYSVDMDRGFPIAEDEPDWTLLSHCRCTNCPLKKEEHKYCPAAVDLRPIIDDFKDLPGIKKASIKVLSPEREYAKMASLEEGLRALMGLVMASSACPILGRLRPMAHYHLPFASTEEFVLRSVSIYLTQQYFTAHEGGTPDWELKGLVSLNKELQLVNQAFWQRVHSACAEDSNLKALLSFFTLSSSVSYSLESQLRKIRSEFKEVVTPV